MTSLHLWITVGRHKGHHRETTMQISNEKQLWKMQWEIQEQTVRMDSVINLQRRGWLQSSKLFTTLLMDLRSNACEYGSLVHI